MNIIERIISQEVSRFIKSKREQVPFYKTIDSNIKDYFFDPNRRILILLVDRYKYNTQKSLYTAIKKFLLVNREFRDFMNELGIKNFDVMYAFPYIEGEYYNLSKTTVTPISKIIQREEQMKVILNSIDDERRKIEMLNDSLQALVKQNPPNKKTQLQFLLELLLSQKPPQSNKIILEDYDLYKALLNIYTFLYGKIPAKRNIQSVITDENAELFKKIIDRHFLINWDGVEGSTDREKVINVLINYGFGVILEILASVDFEMVRLLQGEEKKKKGRKTRKKKSETKKQVDEIKKIAKEELDEFEPVEEPENTGDLKNLIAMEEELEDTSDNNILIEE